jgi:hypothetical protein
LTTSWTESKDREFTIKAWIDGLAEADDTVRKVDVVVVKIEAELEKKWNSTWGAVTNKTGTYPTTSTNAGKKWYVLWDCHENRIKPVIQPTSLSTEISSVSWNAITTSTGTGLWQNITDTSGSFTDVLPTLTLNNGVSLEGKIKTDIAITGVQEVKWVDHSTPSTTTAQLVKRDSSGTLTAENVTLNFAKLESVTNGKKTYPEKNSPTSANFNTLESKITLTQSIPGEMEADLYFYVADNKNPRTATPPDTVITKGVNNGTFSIKQNPIIFCTNYGTTTKSAYLTINKAHAGDDYIAVAHPESGLTVDVNSSTQATWTASGGTANIFASNFQTELVTEWRTLWLERDRMLTPTLPAVGSSSSSDGFHDSERPAKWDTTEPSSEHTEFDLAVRPPELNPALLTTQMVRACVTVSDVPFTTWGITQNEPNFQHNAYTPSIKFDVGSAKNCDELWVLYALSAYESDVSEDHDPNREPDTTFASSDDFVRVFCETVRDRRKRYLTTNPSTTQSYDIVLQRELTHEILHCFLGGHVFISGNIPDMTSITNQGIMRQGSAFTASPSNYSLNNNQIFEIQKKANPKPL